MAMARESRLLAWKAEVRTWQQRLSAVEPSENESLRATRELMERGNLGLLHAAHAATRARSREGDELLESMRLLAEQLQKHARAALQTEGEGLGRDEDCDWRLLAAATLSPWLSHAWCFPRVEVVDYRPCCGTETEGTGLLLSPNCDHSELRAVLDVVVDPPSGGPEGLKLRQASFLRSPLQVG